MTTDPIIEEVYQARRKLLEACGADLKVLLEQIKEAEAQDQHRVVSKADLKSVQQSIPPAR